ncbi:MAG: CHASE2 domain-containing protein [Raineya sp.]
MKAFFRYLFNKDVFLILLFTAIVAVALQSINLNFDALNPLEKMFGDFDMTDVYFSQIRNTKTKKDAATITDAKADERIMVVNIGGAEGGRKRITDLLNIINQYEPECVGVDAFYVSYKTDSIMGPINEELAKAFKNTRNLVMATEARFTQKTIEKVVADEDFEPVFDSLRTSHPNFMEGAKKGLVNLITEATRDNIERSDLAGGLATCRTFSPREKINGVEHLAFGVQLAKIYKPEVADKFLQRGNEVEFINYYGNYEKFGYMNYYQLFEMADAAQEGDEGAKEALKNLFKGKIVLLGFTGVEDIHKVTSDEDRFYTPLNENYVGKAERDMYGIHIHANIISMILNEDYINKMPEWLDYVIAFVIAYLTTALFIFLHEKLDFWYDGLSILVQFLLSVLVVFAILEVFAEFQVKVDWSLGFLAIVFIPNLVEVYYGAVTKLYERRQRMRRLKNKQVATLGIEES